MRRGSRPGGQCREDHRGIHVALVIRGENHRAADRLEVFASVDVNPGEEPRDREDRSAGWRAGLPARATIGSTPKLHRLDRGRPDVPPCSTTFRRAAVARFGERIFVDPRAESVFERHHQLDARASSAQLVDRRLRT